MIYCYTITRCVNLSISKYDSGVLQDHRMVYNYTGDDVSNDFSLTGVSENFTHNNLISVYSRAPSKCG